MTYAELKVKSAPPSKAVLIVIECAVCALPPQQTQDRGCSESQRRSIDLARMRSLREQVCNENDAETVLTGQQRRRQMYAALGRKINI